MTRVFLAFLALAIGSESAAAAPRPGSYRPISADVVICQDPTLLPIARREDAWMRAHHTSNPATTRLLEAGHCMWTFNTHTFQVLGFESVHWRSAWFDGRWDGGVELEARAKSPLGDGTDYYFYVAAADIAPAGRAR